jgi:hypothetical protein
VSIDAVGPDGADSVVTDRPLKLGQSVRPGMVLIEISYRPVIALSGTVPMIRDLSVGSAGDDVAELQESLEKLGWGIYDAPGVFGPSTAAALSGLYRSVGSTVPTAQRTAPEPQAQTDGRSRRGSRSRQAARSQPADVVVARKSELAVMNGLPGTVSAIAAKVGDPAGESVLTVTTSPPTVHASVAPSQRSLVREGQTVTLSSASPAFETRARVMSVGATVQDEETKAYSVPLIVRPRKPLPEGTLEKGLEVRIDVANTAATGMIVPLSAVYTNADGSTAVLKVIHGRASPLDIQILETGSGRARILPEKEGALGTGDLVKIGASN